MREEDPHFLSPSSGFFWPRLLSRGCRRGLDRTSPLLPTPPPPPPSPANHVINCHAAHGLCAHQVGEQPTVSSRARRLLPPPSTGSRGSCSVWGGQARRCCPARCRRRRDCKAHQGLPSLEGPRSVRRRVPPAVLSHRCVLPLTIAYPSLFFWILVLSPMTPRSYRLSQASRRCRNPEE